MFSTEDWQRLTLHCISDIHVSIASLRRKDGTLLRDTRSPSDSVPGQACIYIDNNGHRCMRTEGRRMRE